jgi:hypothetical protein
VLGNWLVFSKGTGYDIDYCSLYQDKTESHE